MLFDDYVLRQVKKIAELVAAVAASSRGATVEGLDEQIAEAYRSLVGLDGDLVDTLGATTLVRAVGDRDTTRALIELVVAHGDRCAIRGDVEGARRRWRKAIALIDEIGGEPEARAAVEARVAGEAAG